MTIGIVCAIEPELAHLKSELTGRTGSVVGQARFDAGELDGHRVVLVGGGMGKVNIAVVATVLADRFGCRAIVFTGVAGGLDPSLNIGDIVIADRTVQHDAGVIEENGLKTYQPGHVPFINPTERQGYPTDSVLLGRVQQRLADFTLPSSSAVGGGYGRPPRISYGTVVTGDQFVRCDVTRDRLYCDFDAIAVEMEGGALAQVCEAFGIPWLVIRALSDLAGRESHFDFAAFVDQAAACSATILRRILPVF
ncbi:5'-methylthioadenosine/S-adenosylhomocysteine nucleosidase [Mycolicibacterium cyprinidarum]|uniref:adenosylhomocysteine nucleosidase n=1 Tax=Mycolicibacterium cyprinidarum TaxID=2860311 RepID=A0ABQ4V6X1_9MYCO|nr:5'-methylthioadenosine/S-adenosylhomocysteine nucleosidase [Mycolicibacterium sp. NGTWSNA01]GJF17591.1 5'-methylthioadenosine/S-adenosylhomocysteine nucleosidase [Mycolicibacterium sp. NGTWS0302]